MKVKCILLDVKFGMIHRVEIDENDIKKMNNLIGSNTFDAVPFNDKNTLYVDDEGLLQLNTKDGGFYDKVSDVLYVGNGLIIGTNPETGGSCDTTVGFTEIMERIEFADKKDLQHIFN